GRTSKREATHDRPKTHDCAGLHSARSYTSADGMLEVAESAAKDRDRKDGQKLALDDPHVGAPADSDFVRVGGKDVHFTLDFQQTQVNEAIGKMGAGKRVEIPGRPLGPSA